MEYLDINSKREELFAPLLEWGILGSYELGELSNYNGSARGLRKMIERAEQVGIINSFIHKMSNRKFVYLTRSAHKALSSGTWNVNEDIKMHDAILSALLYRFSRLDFVSLVKLNGQDINFNQSIFAGGVDPDGMIRAKRKNEVFNVAIEVELTRKNSTEIFKKFKNYLSNTNFSWAFYFFNSKRVLNAYLKYYEEFKKRENICLDDSQIMFFHSEFLARKDFDPTKTTWIRPDGKESTLKSFFMPNLNVPGGFQ